MKAAFERLSCFCSPVHGRADYPRYKQRRISALALSSHRALLLSVGS